MFFISLITTFVPREEYTQKCEETNAPIVQEPILDKWCYDSILSDDLSLNHRYMIHKSSKEDAPTILFIHGLNFDYRVFQKLSNLSNNAELISYELPETTNNYKGSIDDYTSIIDDFLLKLGKDSIIMCGTSFGGLVALRYAAEGKIPSTSLILISTKLAGARRKDYKQTLSLERLVKRKEDYQIYWIMEKLVDDFKKDLRKEGREDITNLLKIRDISFYRQVTYSMSGHKSEEDAAKLSIPTILLNGKGDHLIKDKDIEIFKKKVPNAIVKTIKNGTHALAWVHGEELAEEISRFIN